MIKISFLVTLVIITLVFQACTDQKKEEAQSANNILSTNEYVLTALNKKQFLIKKEKNGFKLQNADGKIVIFDIFATWCPPCQAGATHLTSLSNKYTDKLVVIGVTIEENIPNSKLQKFKEEHNAHYTLVNSTENRRFVDTLASSLQLGERFPIPIVAMYKDGQLINYYVGAIEKEFIESDIKKALGK